MTLITAVDPQNIIEPTDNEGEQSTADTMLTSSVLSPYSFRSRKGKQRKLVYDLKYHPMDDSVRPSLAAKRRSAHGEIQFFSDDRFESFSRHADSSADSDAEGERVEEVEKKPKPICKGKKRVRCQSESPEPTRRSLRKTTDQKVSYNMSVHPQDDDLIMLSADDDDHDEAPTPIVKRKKLPCLSRRREAASRQHDLKNCNLKDRTEASRLTETSSDVTDMDDEPTFSRGSSSDGAETITAEDPGRCCIHLLISSGRSCYKWVHSCQY